MRLKHRARFLLDVSLRWEKLLKLFWGTYKILCFRRTSYLLFCCFFKYTLSLGLDFTLMYLIVSNRRRLVNILNIPTY